jgi:adenylyltransferase/sulfurtransferase
MSRHLMMPEIGEAGQLKLKSASVLVVGCGGLGSPAALYLAAAGVGRIGLVDDDLVDASNLQRQVLFTTKDIGKQKALRAAERLRELNPHIEIEAIAKKFDYANAIQLVSNYDVILDGTDNFSTRFLINDASVALKKINVHASVFKFEGQIGIFGSEKGPCYRCVFPTAPPKGMMPACGEIGVLGVVPGIMGCLQAAEAIKVILGLGRPLLGQIIHVDTLTMSFRRLTISKDPQCPVCSHRTPALLNQTVYGGNAEVGTVTSDEFNRLITQDDVSVIDTRELCERELDSIPGSLHIPLASIDASIAQISLGKMVVVYCARGSRGEQAVIKLQKIFPDKKILNLAGGIISYRQNKSAIF